MINTTDTRNALKACERELADIERKHAIQLQDAYQRYQDYMHDYNYFWTRPQIPDSAFDMRITWYDLWLALWRNE